MEPNRAIGAKLRLSTSSLINLVSVTGAPLATNMLTSLPPAPSTLPRKHKFHMLAEKHAMVHEAFYSGSGKKVKATACKYCISTTQLRFWKKNLENFRLQKSREEWRDILQSTCKTLHLGPCCILSDSEDELLHQFFEEMQELHRVVTVGLLCAEYTWICPEIADISHDSISKGMSH